MQITVIGGKGFIGGHLVDHYLSKGYIVNVIDNGSTGDYINPKAHYFDYDVSNVNFNKLIEICEHSDIILHLAATARVQPSFTNPQKYFQNNVLSVVNVLESLRNIKYNGKFIYFSTSSVYGSINKYIGSTEHSILKPSSPYALSKKHCEEICEWYRQQYHLDIVIVRPFNVYGDRMSNINGYQTVISKFFTQYINNEPLSVFGDGNNSRDYTYIGDIISAIELISNKGTEYIYNIASSHPISINAIIDRFPWQYPITYLPKVDEPIITRGSITLLKNIGYTPKGNVLKWIENQIPKLKK